MGNNLKSACDGILQKVVTGKAPRSGRGGDDHQSFDSHIYEGAAGERVLGWGTR